MKKDLMDGLKTILIKGVGVREVHRIASEAVQDPHLYEALVMLSGDENESTRMKSSWALAKATENKPDLLSGHVEKLLTMLEKEKKGGVMRELFKTLFHAPIPPDMEGRFIDLCFAVLRSMETDIAVKHYGKLALLKFVRRYPELKPELVASLYSVADLHTAPWKRQVLKTVHQLEHGQS